MKKTVLRIAALLLALSMMMLVGCGDNGEKEDTSSAAVSSKVAVSKKPVSKVQSREEVSSGPVMPEKNDYSQMTFNFTEIGDYIKTVGRFAATKTGVEAGSKPCLAFDQTAQTIEFIGDCEGDVTVTMSIKASGGPAEHYWLVSVDGTETRVKIEGVANMERKVDVAVATGLKRGKHTFKIVRENELNFGIENLISVTLNGVLTEPPANKKYYIEVLGDSITAGYGNLTVNGDKEGPSWPEKSDGTQTYAYLAAKILDADICAVARSGLEYTNGLAGLPIETYWQKISWARTGLGDYKPEKEPDVVVINLGTNDHNELNSQKMTRDELKASAVKLIKLVRADRPNAKIVWGYGMMGSDLANQFKQAVEECGGESAGIYYCSLPQCGWNGGDGHPNVAEHTKAAEKLAGFLGDILK